MRGSTASQSGIMSARRQCSQWQAITVRAPGPTAAGFQGGSRHVPVVDQQCAPRGIKPPARGAETDGARLPPTRARSAGTAVGGRWHRAAPLVLLEACRLPCESSRQAGTRCRGHVPSHIKASKASTQRPLAVEERSAAGFFAVPCKQAGRRAGRKQAGGSGPPLVC